MNKSSYVCLDKDIYSLELVHMFSVHGQFELTHFIVRSSIVKQTAAKTFKALFIYIHLITCPMTLCELWARLPVISFTDPTSVRVSSMLQVSSVLLEI